MRHAPARATRPSGLSAVVLAGSALALAACGAESPSAPSESASRPAAAAPSGSAPPSDPAPPAAAAAPAAEVDAAGIDWGHIHHLAYDGGALLLGTHHGLYRQPLDARPALLSATEFDVMGLAYDGTRWLASGHPAPGEDLPPDLGLRASDDGRTWTSVSLLGQVDFHRLTASGATVMGVAARDGALLRSADSGDSWAQLENPGIFDVALDPADASRAIATTERGPLRSTDAGTSWQRAEGAPLLAFVAWDAGTAYGVAPDGAVHVSADGGATWQAAGSVDAQPAALAAGDGRIAVLVKGAIVESVDGGQTFAPRITGIAGH